MASTLVGRSGSGSVLFVVARTPGLGFERRLPALSRFFRVMVLRVIGLHLQIGFCRLFWIPDYARAQSHMSPSLVGHMFSTGSIAGFLALGILADILGRKPTTWLYYLGAPVFSLSLFLVVRERHVLLFMSAAGLIVTACRTRDERDAAANLILAE